MVKETMDTIAFRVGRRHNQAIQKLADVLKMTVSDTVRSTMPDVGFFEMSAVLGLAVPPVPLLLDRGIRSYMANDDKYPVVAEQLSLDGTALYELFVAWYRAKSGKKGYSLERVTGENDVVRYRVKYPATELIRVAKCSNYEKNQRQTLRELAPTATEQEVDEALERLRAKSAQEIKAKNEARRASEKAGE